VAAKDISRLTSEQSHASEQAAATVGELAQVIFAIGAASEQTLLAAERLEREADALERVTGQFQLRR
jgi:methyl-accepting chemotaxis protein